MHDGERARRRTYRAERPERALIWMRSEVRMLLSGFGAQEQDRACRWLDHGQWEAIHRLRAGESYAFSVSVGTTRFTWSARSVLFLPLIGAPGTTPRLCRSEEESGQ